MPVIMIRVLMIIPWLPVLLSTVPVPGAATVGPPTGPDTSSARAPKIAKQVLPALARPTGTQRPGTVTTSATDCPPEASRRRARSNSLISFCVPAGGGPRRRLGRARVRPPRQASAGLGPPPPATVTLAASQMRLRCEDKLRLHFLSIIAYVYAELILQCDSIYPSTDISYSSIVFETCRTHRNEFPRSPLHLALIMQLRGGGMYPDPE